jgi:tetratricopeptide (TPR) repeat protein
MAVNCKYHPAQPAAHLCPKCNTYFCSNCIVKRQGELYGNKRDVFICPKCNIYTKPLAVSYKIEPFWTRLPKIFAYPLHWQPIILLLIVAALNTYSGNMFIVGIFIQFACFGVALTYSYAALTSTVHGNFKAPPISMESVNNNFGIVFKQYAVFLIIGAVSFKLLSVNLFFGVIFIIAALLLLPAMIIILAETKSILAAINPQVIFLLAWRIGRHYLLLCFFLITLAAAPGSIVAFIGKSIPRNISIFLGTFCSYYYMLVAYHLMGYILFQYHEKLGYEIDYDGENEPVVNHPTPIKAASTVNERLNNELLNKLNILIKEGNLDEAISLIREETRGNITDPVLAERYFNLMQLKQMNPELLVYGRNYIPLLIKSNQKDKLCEVYLTCKSIDENFINDAGSLYITAKTLNEKNNHTEAKQAFERFISMDEKHPLVPNAYFFIAKILNEKLNEPLKASEIIKSIINKYPFHENTAYIQTYLKQIKT